MPENIIQIQKHHMLILNENKKDMFDVNNAIQKHHMLILNIDTLEQYTHII